MRIAHQVSMLGFRGIKGAVVVWECGNHKRFQKGVGAVGTAHAIATKGIAHVSRSAAVGPALSAHAGSPAAPTGTTASSLRPAHCWRKVPHCLTESPPVVHILATRPPYPLKRPLSIPAIATSRYRTRLWLSVAVNGSHRSPSLLLRRPLEIDLTQPVRNINRA